MRRFLMAVIIMSLLFGNSSIAMSITPDEQTLVNLVNQERVSRGLTPLILKPSLMKSSDWFCANVVRHSPFTLDNLSLYYNESHVDYDTGLSSWQRIEKIEPKAAETAENIDTDFNVQAAHLGFMQSPSHKANILNPRYKYIGVSIKPIVINGNNEIFVVEDFMSGSSLPVRFRYHKGHKRHIQRHPRQRK